MKCADLICDRKVRTPGEKYCSSVCVPVLERSSGRGIKSVLTVSSFSMGDGSVSDELSSEEDETGNEREEKDHAEEKPQSGATTPTTKSHSLINDWHRNGSIGKTQKRVEPMTNLNATSLTQQGRSVALSVTSEEVKSESTNLIDGSLNHLYELMKSVRTDVNRGKLDPQAINSACNCAKQMTTLLKLKLEISRRSTK